MDGVETNANRDETSKKRLKAQKEKERDRYGILSNVAYMIRLARRVAPSVLVLMVLRIVLLVAQQLLEFFALPSMVALLEQHVPLADLVGTILFFGLGIMFTAAIHYYFEAIEMPAQIEVRSHIILDNQEKMMTTSYPLVENEEFTKKMNAALTATMSNQSPTEAIWGTLTKFAETLILAVFYYFVLTKLPPVLVLVTLVTTIISFYLGRNLHSWGFRHRDIESGYNKVLDYTVGAMGNHTYAMELRLFGMRTWFNEVFEKTARMVRKHRQRASLRSLVADVIDILFSVLRNGIAYYYLLTAALNGGLSASSFLLLFTAVGYFTERVQAVFQSAQELHKSSLQLSAIREYRDWPDVFNMGEGRAIPEPGPKGYQLELEHVTFRYPGAEADTYTDLNITVHPGERLGIVGLNGAGKTTLVKIMAGFYDPTEGRVLLNGIDIREFNRREYYDLFSAVFQEQSMLAGPLYLDIAQSTTPDMDKVNACIDMAGFRGKVDSLTNGIETLLGKDVYPEAVELSGGERQRLLLARALYKDSHFMILDEPTAALDPIAESEIYEKYHSLTEGKTSIFISHRLASTRFCDRILLVGQGGILESGTHQSLMNLGGEYAKLFEVQSQYYKEHPEGESDAAAWGDAGDEFLRKESPVDEASPNRVDAKGGHDESR